MLEITIDGVILYWSVSQSGFKTRLFESPGEAFAEEQWLDEMWDAICALCHNGDVPTEQVEDAAKAMVCALMSTVQRGLRPVEGLQELPKLEFYRAEGPGEFARLVVAEANATKILGVFLAEDSSILEGNAEFSRLIAEGSQRRRNF